MITLHNPNMVSWSACRIYRHKQETGSKSIEKVKSGARPLQSVLVRIVLGMIGFPSA